jgi:thioredoxin reductase
MKTPIKTMEGSTPRTKPATALLSPDTDVAIIGAGPYGLSAGAHLKAKGLGVRVFGQPMEFWANRMPSGMLLRSPRAASSIADPRGAFTLEAYEAAAGLKPCWRVPLETFVAYGLWFRQQLDSSIDSTPVAQVTREKSLFRLTLQNGETVTSRRVVVAAGIGAFARKPKPFTELPRSLASHCYEGVRVADFAGRRVAVIGAGQSALECAALLSEAGASVEVIARIPELRWIGAHKWLHQMGPISSMLYSKYDVGPIGVSRLVSWPRVVYHIPGKIKDKIRTRAVRSAGSPWLVPRLGSVILTTGRTVVSARAMNSEVNLRLDDGTERRVDHVLLGTGYRVDLSSYRFLPSTLLSQVQQDGGYPVVTAGFHSSVPGLHFIGAAAAKSFGPLLYFVAGTEFASRALASHISQNRVTVSA